MQKLTLYKLASAPIAPYEPNAVYAVRAGAGFTLQIADKDGAAVYGLNGAATDPTSAQIVSALGYTPVNPNALGAANGVATLDVAGKVPAAQLPSFVDDVQDFANFAALPATGEKSKIYVLETPYKLGNVTSSQFRWSGTAYAPIIASPGSTDAVPEGATNKYFTDARAMAAVQSVPGSAGSVTGLTLTSAANGINPDTVTANQIGYNTSVSLFGQTDGGLYSSAYSASWVHQIYGDFRTGQIATRGKNKGTWQAWRVQLDSSNYNSYAPALTGGGASGTWGINITGSAANVTGIVGIANGGTGANSAQAASRNLATGAYSREVNGGTLVAGTRYGIWTAGGAITMGMPTFENTANGDEIECTNLHQTWAGNPFTITCPAANVKINMLTENLVCNHNAGGFTLVCVWKDASSAFWTVRT